MKFLCLALIAIGLSACTGGVTPRTLSQGEAGRNYLSSCQNLVPNSRPVDEFITEFYLTTSGSAISEGAIVGAREALEEDPGIGRAILSTMVPPRQVGSRTLVPRRTPPEPYCVLVDSSPSVVSRAARTVMSRLRPIGYRTSQVGRSPAVYETSFRIVDRASDPFRTRWMDRYIVIVEPWDDNRAALIVARDIFISRQESPYIQAISVGANEAWLAVEIQNGATN